MNFFRSTSRAGLLSKLAKKAALLAIVGIPLSGYSSGTVTNLNWFDLDNALVGGGTVTIACDGTIYKPYTYPDTISANTVITAAGHHVILDGWNSWGGQMFLVNSNVTLTLSNLSVADCLTTSNGSAIFNQGTTLIYNCIFTNNVAQGQLATNGANGINVSSGTAGNGGNGTPGGSITGGAIYNQGTLVANLSTFIDNQAYGATGGAGGNGGNATSGTPGNGGNGAIGGNAYGGAIFSANVANVSVAITNCSFLANAASAGWGGNGGNGGLGSTNAGANGVGGPGTNGYGGALYIYRNATIVDSTFFENFAGAGQGGDSGLTEGVANTTGGKGGAGYGGAVFNVGTNAYINCTFCQNEAGGGPGGTGGAGTTGGTGGQGGNAYGGGIYSTNQIGVTNCSFVLNAALAGAGGDGGYPSGSDGANGTFFGGNILRTNGTFTLKNSLFAYGTNYGGNGFGTFVDAGENLSDDNSITLTGTGSHSLINILVTNNLQYNGGPTGTSMLLAGSPAINAADSTAAPTYDQRGFMRVGAPDIGAFEYGSGTPSIFAAGPTASLNGDVGLFLIGRVAADITPLTVNYTVSGTASNGVDYVQITNSVTIYNTVTNYDNFARIPLRGILGAFSATNKSVTVTLNSGTNYQIDPSDSVNPSTATIFISPQSTFNSAARFVRGSSTAPDFQSFVVPLNFQTGVPLALSGGNAATLFPGNQWTNTLYYIDATNSALQTNLTGRVAFENPIVAFGSPVGGSPLNLDQSYAFGIHAGDTSLNYSNALRIQVYYRSNSAWAGTISLPIPNTAVSNQLANYATNGFTQTFTQFGLQTVWSTSPSARWGVMFDPTYVLTHTAMSAVATNYYYVVEAMGNAAFAQPMVLNQSGTQDWSKLYAMEFSPTAANFSTFINQPHFAEQPLPPAYTGATLDELTNVVPVLPNLSFLNPSNYLTIDGSPELRRHPILDQFVANMGNDPLALANYVVNEISLVDAIDYDTNYNSLPAINVGGVNRGAIGTFQEGQGSPIEQCALLVYLLRQAGVPATYLFPTNGGLQMLDAQVSKMLRMQLQGALSPLGQTNLPQLISLNYPWVAAYIGTNWVQIFPWIKDTEITEGFNFYDYMPTNYNSGFKWLTAYINNDTNIFSLNSSDQPLDLLPAFIQHNLDLNHYGLSVDDMGVQCVNRRHLYSQWNQFPEPFALSGTPMVVESLKTNMSLFNTLDIQVYSQANPTRLLDTTAIPIAELHNRKLLLKFQQIGTNNLHNMILSLEAFSPNVTNTWSFSTRADPTWALVSSNRLDSTDDAITFQITHTLNHFLPANYLASSENAISNLWDYTYFEQGAQNGQSYVQTDTFRKGDLVAFGFDLGNVTSKMLNVYAQELWQFNQNANTNVPSTIDPDIYEGDPAYLLAMSFFNYYDQFHQLNNQLHKMQVVSQYEQGYGLLRPQRDSNGNLINGGQINLITPAIHMPDNGFGTVFNGSLHPDSGQDTFSTAYFNWFAMEAVQGSAAEHGTLRSFYQTNAISTVKLLQQVAPNMVTMTADNYLAAGQVSYNGVQLQNADTNAWSGLVNLFSSDASAPEAVAFMTPGVVTNGTYVGVGYLYFSDDKFSAAVGGLNGGFADNFPTTTFSYDNSPNITVTPSPAGSATSFQLQTTSTADSSGSAGGIVNGATATWTQSATYASLANGQSQLAPSLNSTLLSDAALYGSQENAPAVYNQSYNIGTSSTTVPVYSDWSQTVADPVNMMTGEFYIDAPDISLPGPMPLQIRRNYSSQNLAENQFGFGWKTSYVPYLSVGTNSTLIYAAEMDGSMVAYRQTATNANVWLPEPQDNPMLNNNSSMGIGSTGNLFNNRLQLTTPGSTNTYTLTGANGGIRTFVQASYPVGTFNRQRPYLNKWQDNRGNFYTFQYGTNSAATDYGEVNRIQSSNGNFVWFVYDVYGHILEAHTGDGRILEYVYDQFGDLVSVTLPDQMEIDYVYQHLNDVTNGVTNVYSTHLIVEEDKPDGRVLQNLYDSQRRVTNQLSTAGADLNPVLTGTFVYTNNFSLSSPTNLLTGVTVISDYFNHSTTYYYTNSLIQKIVDPLNQTIVQTWYQTNGAGGFQRSLQSVTDKRGLQTTYLYDSFGNLTNNIITGDITGNGITNQTATNAASYNTNNLPVQITDAVGNSQVVVYDPVFNFLPQQTIRYAGTTPVSTNLMVYANATNIVVLGNTTQTNTAFGVLMRNIRAYGSSDAATNDSLCNGQGFPTNSIQYTGTGDPNITNQLFFDERGELIQRTDAVGADYTFAFDPMGRPAAQETFDTGQDTPMDWKFTYYDANGEVNWIDGPRYNPEDYIFYDYDGDGRVTTEIHWRSEANSSGTGVEAPAGNNVYAQIFCQYDPLGNVLSKIDPRGAVTTNTFDALCRLTQSTHLDTNGLTVLSTDGYTYEPGGLMQSHTNALGGITTTFYTTTGKPETRYNADGSTNAWRYYSDGRIQREIQSNGAYWQTTYDDVNRITTRVFYSALGVAEATNSTQLDRRGNVIQRVDEGGNIFTTAFDGLDRAKVTAGPAIVTVVQQSGMSPGGPYTYITNVLQQVVTNFYDAAGRVLTNVNALGETSITTMDAIGRTTGSQIYSAGGTLVHQAYIGYSADHNSATTTNGSGANAIINTTWTDNDGHTVLSIAYPNAYTNEFTLSQYDLAGNLISRQHDSSSSGTVTTWTTASYTYDGLNRMINAIDRDGAPTTYRYDLMSDPTNRTMPGGLQWQAAYNNAGQMTNEQNYGSGTPTRMTSYVYYPSGNTFAGLLETKTDGRGTACTYTYDDRLRQSSMTYSGSLPEQNMTTTWQYDPRSLPTNITEQFASTNTDPTTTIVRSYDPYGQLSSESVSAGAFSYNSSQSWDAAGRRSLLDIGAANYGFGWQADGNLISASDPTGTGNYSYDTAGMLTNRLVGNRMTSITSRDGEGRPLSIATTVNLLSELNETLSWSGDGLLTAHTLARADFTDPHIYTYANLSRRLVQEQVNLNASTTWTNSLVYDNGVAGGPGVLTQMGLASGASNEWSGASDAFSRVVSETNSTLQFPAYGHVNGQSIYLSAWLDNQPVSIAVSGTNAMQWRAMMELAPGVHQLKVSALHPSGIFTAWATNSFTNTLAYEGTADNYDAAGNITNRVWKNPGGTVERTQTLSWDARGRLHQVIDRDANNSGYNWTAVYDGLNRRLQTTTVMVSNNVTSTTPPQVLDSYFDPQVEFLELGVSDIDQTVWKLYGPDLNGKYGGLNGTGGLDGVSPYLSLFNPVISDFRGNILAEETNGIVSWTPARPTGYGAVPGYRPVALADDADVPQSSAWRGREVDITGYYNIGLRPYDPISGRWLTYDSVWNESDPNYYTFAGGEPIMGFDPDGRLGKSVYNEAELDASSLFSSTMWGGMASDTYNLGARTVNGVVQAGAIGSDMIGSSSTGLYDSIFGTDYEANYQGYSTLYQNIYNTPSSGPTSGQILTGTVQADANVATLGLYGMTQAYYTGITTGNYNSAQDASLNALLLSGGARGMQSQGVNPWGIGSGSGAVNPAGVSQYSEPIGPQQPPSITTPYATEVQSSSAQAQAALAQAQNGATLYRMGQTGVSMTGESQYWSLQNPLLNPNYANSMGMPGVTSDFIMTGTVRTGASVIANEAPGLGANTGNGIQIVTEPGGVEGLTFHMPDNE
jgi:RHS repeat-associated protein